jgi:hypothetical protein
MGCAASTAASPLPQQLPQQLPITQHMPSTDEPCAEILPSTGTLLNHQQVDMKKEHAEIQPRPRETISIQVTSLGGEVHMFDLPPFATVLDVKVLIQQRLGHHTWNQKLVSASTVLADSNASLESLGIADNSVLMLLVDREPIGQSALETPSGKKPNISGNSCDEGICKRLLNQFELQSWQAACASPVGQDIEWNDSDWGNIGASGLDLYWTTAPDGCRYEYWSSAPGDNEAGCLVRVDADNMVAIAEGSDDGLSLFDDCVAEFENNEVWLDLVKQGWPRPRCWMRDSDEDEDEDEDEDSSDEDEES